MSRPPPFMPVGAVPLHMELRQHEVEARDGLGLNVWEAPADSDEAVLFLHGAITCSRALLAPPVPGDDSYSWLHAAAAAGRTAFALDVRGYGDSDRPPESSDPPVRADAAARDVADVHEVVSERFDTVHLVGISWGTMTGGAFLAAGDPAVATFASVAPVYAPTYDFETGLAELGLEPDLPAWITQTREVVEERQDADADRALFEAVWEAQVASGQGLEETDGYVFQSGSLADVRDCCAGDPPYDAGAIATPTLVIRGSEDGTSGREDALALYDELGSTGDLKEYGEVAGAGHYVMHGPRRRALYAAVSAFQDRY